MSRLIIKDPLVRSSWRRVLHLWKPMAAWTLLLWFFMVLLMAPFTTMVLGLAIFQGDNPVIGNEELIGWLSSPSGIFYLILAGSFGLISSVVRFAGIFEIVTEDLKGQSPGLRMTALKVTRLLPWLFKTCLIIVAAFIVFLIPLAGGLGLIYNLFLGEHDINFYLVMRPADWYYAMGFGILWLTVWTIAALYVTGRSILSLPAYLANDYTFFVAIRKSWFYAKDRTVRLLRLMAFVIVAWLIIRLAMDMLLIFTASRTLEIVASFSSSVRLVVLITAVFVALSVFLSIITGFFAFSFGSTLLTKFYYEDTDLHISSMPAPGFRLIQAKISKMIEPWLTPKRIVPLIIIAAAVSLIGSSYWLDQIPEPGEAFIAAHRTGPSPAPENTLSALEAAIESGAHYSEIDVQRTKDNTVVLVHDADLMRVAGVPNVIAESDYVELRNIIQRPDDGTPAPERRVATLSDVLERAGGRIRLMIELKYYEFDPLLAEEVATVIQNYGMEDQVVIMSLDLDAVRQVQRLAPDIPVGYISTFVIGDISRIPVDFLAINRQGITSALIRNAHQRDMKVYAWTVNRGDDMADLIELGVDGLITDDPALAILVQNELNEMTAVERLLLRFQSLIIDRSGS